jgi:hypothetical protein
MNGAKGLSVTIVHSLPGRLRVHLSHLPTDTDSFIADVKGHEGIGSVGVSPSVRSLLVTYRHEIVEEQEIIVRIALSLSMERGGIAVLVMGEADRRSLSLTAAVSGAALLYTLLAGRFRAPLVRQGPLLAAGATALAVVDHAWQEIRLRGYFDPEVVSIGYLAGGMMRGRPLQAAVVTWLATFGRHFFEMSRPGIVIKPVGVGKNTDETPAYRVVLSSREQSSPAARLLKAAAKVLQNATDGGSAGLLDGIKKVSEAHGRILHGTAWMPKGIPIEFH